MAAYSRGDVERNYKKIILQFTSNSCISEIMGILGKYRKYILNPRCGVRLARGKIGSCDMIVARKMKGFRNRTDWPLMLHRRNNFRKESSPKWKTKA